MTYPDNLDVFEHGIVVGNGDSPPKGLARLATTREPIYSGYTLSLVDRDGSSLNHRAVQCGDVPGAHAVKDYYEESDVRFFLREALYHLNRIVDLYVEKCRGFEERHRDAVSGNTGDPRIAFEVDAFLGAARRVYEAISKVLWKHHAAPRGMRGRWRSIQKAVDAAENENSDIIPEQFGNALIQSWETTGSHLKAYRDYVAHTAALNLLGTCWMTWYDGRWGATVALPADPESKIRVDADASNGIDALAYCHGVAGHLIGLAEALMSLPEIRFYLNNPPGYSRVPQS